MGEIAEMMLEGTLCEGCGEYMGEGDGFVRRCAACRDDGPAITIERNIPCAECNKTLSPTGIFAHIDAKHGSVKVELRAFEVWWQRKHPDRNKKSKVIAWEAWRARADK